MIDGYMVLHINASLYIIYNHSTVPYFVTEAAFLHISETWPIKPLHLLALFVARTKFSVL